MVEGVAGSASIPDSELFSWYPDQLKGRKVLPPPHPPQGGLVFTTHENTGPASLSKQDCLSFNQQRSRPFTPLIHPHYFIVSDFFFQFFPFIENSCVFSCSYILILVFSSSTPGSSHLPSHLIYSVFVSP